MSALEKYRELCANESSVPLFSQAWWLDTVCENKDWGVCLVEKNGEVHASMPYCMRNRFGYTLLAHPPLTKTLGPWIRPSKARYSKCLAQQKKLMSNLIDKLPQYSHFSQNWHYSMSNWLPFYWQGFQQTTRYTYVIEDLTNSDKLWINTLENIRREIRKATTRFNLKVRTDLDIEEFLLLNKMTFQRQGIKTPYSDAFVRKINNMTIQRMQSKFFIAQDPQGNNHAGVYIIWDNNSAYYLMGGADPRLRNSGATSLCMWEAIKFASTVTKTFDFEGSMIESVERFFRGFGAVQKAYSNITNTPSKSLRGIMALKQITYS